jgi:hypothetical protein
VFSQQETQATHHWGVCHRVRLCNRVRLGRGNKNKWGNLYSTHSALRWRL